MDERNALARAEWRNHWPLVMAAAVGFAFSSITSASTGLFMEPLGREFGWSRTLQSSGVSITAVLTMLMSPFFGVAIDRFGTRRMALAGIIGAALIISSFSLANGSAVQWIGLWVAYAFAAVMIKSTVWSAAVSSVFTNGRGLALGLTLSGTAVAQAIIPPITNYLIDSFGWRGAMVWLGMGGGAIAFLFCALWLFDGYDVARKKRRIAEAAGEIAGPATLLDVPGLSIPQAWRSTALWRIGISTFVMMVITIALNVHQFEILRGIGIDRTSAAWLTSIAGVMGVIGKLVTGWLLDRYHPKSAQFPNSFICTHHPADAWAGRYNGGGRDGGQRLRGGHQAADRQLSCLGIWRDAQFWCDLWDHGQPDCCGLRTGTDRCRADL